MEQGAREKTLSESIKVRLGRMREGRSIIEEQWEEISEKLLPIKGGFTGDRIKYERNSKKRYDSTAGLANDELARDLSGLLTSQAFKWFGIKTKNIDLMNDRDIRIYLEKEESAIFDELATSNFYSQADELYSDLPALGTGVMYREMLPTGKKLFKTLWLGECYVEENAEGVADVLFRRFQITPRVAAQKFGEENLGKYLKDKLINAPEELVWFIHATYPREDRVFMNMTKENKKFASIYVCENDGYIVEEGGTDSFPFYIPRWRKRAGDPYGFGPGIIALADIRMLNEMSKTVLKAGQKVVEPPILMPNDSFMMPANTQLNGVNYYEPGTEDYMRPFPTSGNIPLGLELEDRRREMILRAFHADKLQLQKESVEMTKAEAVIRDRENLRKMAPITSRIEREFLKPVIEDMIIERQRSGRAGEIPERLKGQEVDIEFVSPMARARKSDEADSVFNTLNLAAQLAQFEPTVGDRLDADKILLRSDDWFGMQNSLMKSDGDFARVKQQRAQDAQAEQNAMALESAAKVMPKA